jgi:hypothetical protein
MQLLHEDDHGFLALENAAGINAELLVRVGQVGSITGQTAGCLGLAICEHGWYCVVGRTRYDRSDESRCAYEGSVRADQWTSLLTTGESARMRAAPRASSPR